MCDTYDKYDHYSKDNFFKISRRDALKRTAAIGSAFLLPDIIKIDSARANSIERSEKFEAAHYNKLENKKIQCQLCPKECKIDNMERGFCGVRENVDGIYYTYVHSNPCSINIDPIEKKPLFHFLPGTAALSMATVGCNVDCKFCQNWQISQIRPEEGRSMNVTPGQMAGLAIENNCPSIAYTYTEPVIFYEYMYDCAAAGHENKVKSVMISNGYIKEKPMTELVKHLDAVKIDLKAFTETYYRDICIGELQPVLDTLILLKKLNIWTEIVYLVVPTLNDDTKELRDMCRWIFYELGPDIPLHFSRFYPQYKLKNLPPTPIDVLEKARDIALEAGIHYVYIGNVPGNPAENTYCPKCENCVVKRTGYAIIENNITEGKCENCGNSIAGIWQ